MTSDPLISIITPVYNQERFIEQTIRSVLDQTYRDWEWIILDDGSTDGTGDIIRRVKDSRVRYHVQEHAGPERLARTFNNALALCSGVFIALLDGDDFWPHHEKLAIQSKTFGDSDIVLSYGESQMINHTGKKIGYMSIPDNTAVAHNNPIGSSLRILLLQRYCFLPNSTVMIRRETLSNIGGFVEAEGLTQDFPTWTRLSLEGRFAPIRACLGCWRRHASSTNLTSNLERLFDAGIDFLKIFVRTNESKLRTLGLFSDFGNLEKQWNIYRQEYVRHLHYNGAMLMLQLGMFREARAEFNKFAISNPSVKNACIRSLVNIACAMNVDFVNPIATLKSEIDGVLKAKKCKSL